eukprot:m.68315 g.68315  ORF g.68315 m.68315 type:complete len:233 (+) comp11958_c0_seq1:280-978(+)
MSSESKKHQSVWVSIKAPPPPNLLPGDIRTTEATNIRAMLAEYNILRQSWSRGSVLVLLMLLQSASSFILDYFQELLKSNVVIVLFLTMLVGAGGNAGNQCAVHVIRGLAVGKVDGRKNVPGLILSEILTGACTASAMSIIAYLRVRGTSSTAANDAFAISMSLFIIVTSSCMIGTVLPLVLYHLGLDPAHAGPSIQVIMDVLGVAITCVVCQTMIGQGNELDGSGLENNSK